ncbi:MAG: hypothetical protein AB7Q17_04655 [Phycisphaerae bacterium]
MKWLRFVLGSAAVIAGVVWSTVYFSGWELRRAREENERLERARQELVQHARRLEASRRAAQITVLAQSTDAAGVTQTRLQWQEIARDGFLGTPVVIEARGRLVYCEALVLKFEPRHVAEADPERGVSLALFRRVFGDQQSPDSAIEFDRAARPRQREPELHTLLWSRFWELVDQPDLAARFGVRVAQIEAPAAPMAAGQVWEVTIDAAGGVNLRKIAERPN